MNNLSFGATAMVAVFLAASPDAPRHSDRNSVVADVCSYAHRPISHVCSLARCPLFREVWTRESVL